VFFKNYGQVLNLNDGMRVDVELVLLSHFIFE